MMGFGTDPDDMAEGLLSPINTSPRPDTASMSEARPICHLLTPIEPTGDAHVTAEVGVDAVYALPAGGPRPIPDTTLTYLAGIVDRGGSIALHATDAEAIADAVDAILVGVR